MGLVFLSKGSLQPKFRMLLDKDRNLPTKIRWLIECHIQSFLQHCAISTTATEADDGLHLLAFDMFQHMLKDGIHIGLPSCEALTPALPRPPSTPTAGPRHQNQQSPSMLSPNLSSIPTQSIGSQRTSGKSSWTTLPPVQSHACVVCITSIARPANSVPPVLTKAPLTKSSLPGLPNAVDS